LRCRGPCTRAAIATELTIDVEINALGERPALFGEKDDLGLEAAGANRGALPLPSSLSTAASAIF